MQNRAPPTNRLTRLLHFFTSKFKTVATQVNITEQAAINAYNEADAKGRALLENLFPQLFKRPITERVKTFEDACAVLGLYPTNYAKWDPANEDAASILAYSKLAVITRALNEGWVPDWSNSSEYKYSPYFEFKAGSGFSSSDTGCDNTDTCLGSRLVYRTRELAVYAGQQFTDIYNQFLKP